MPKLRLGAESVSARRTLPIDKPPLMEYKSTRMKIAHAFPRLVLTALFLGPAVPIGRAAEPRPDGVVYVIPVQGMIEPALTYVIRRGVKEAEARKARALILHMDTPGGSVSATEEIVGILQKVTIPTYTFADKNAISAGAIIALATRHIYMAPGSKIGDAMPIMAAPTGGVQPLPDAEREKITSYVDTIIRSAAEQSGHDKQLATKMVRREGEYRIGDDLICPEGQILTLTNIEAERRVGEDQRPMLSLGTVADLPALLDTIGLPHASLITLEVTSAERIARFIAALAPLFLMGGLLGLYIEFKTPGFGLPGLLGLVCLGIFFWGHHIAGLAGMEDLVILLVGVTLLIIEVFFLPGFGLVGLLGASLIAGSLLGMMIERLPGDPVLPTWPQLEIPLMKMTLGFFLSLVAAFVLGRFLPNTPLVNRLVLHEAEDRTRGYAASSDTHTLVGLTGVAVSDLRPAGAGMFGDRRLDVLTRGEFISNHTPIQVVETHGNRIIVEQVG
jgi:membrane-bound serine protease (ClpP class)